jgi:hypothetical protein
MSVSVKWLAMSVDYQVWVIPKERTFRPTAEQLANLASALRDGGWVPKPEAIGQQSQFLELLPGGDPKGLGRKPARSYPFTSEPFTASWVDAHSENELVLSWHVQDTVKAGVQYPFSFDPFPDSGPPYFYVYVLLGRDFFYHTGENVTEFSGDSTTCPCGQQLAFWTGYASGAPSQRIYARCPKCDRAFDPTEISCTVLDVWTGATSLLSGGLTFHFALVVNCHKYYPREEKAARSFHLREEFLDLWRVHVGIPFEQIVTVD